MKWIVACLIVLGFGAAICAAILVGTLRAEDGSIREIRPASETSAQILVATRALPAMTVVDGSAVTTREVASSEAPANAEGKLTSVIGKVLIAPMVEGEVFTTSRFASDKSGMRLATALPEGRRAMSTYLSAESGIEELIYPGAIVDVIASFRMPTERGGAAGEVLSSTLLQSVEVLAIGPRTIMSPDREEGDADASPKQKRMVTLMVTPEQAEVLQLATTHGQVTLALRHPLDAAAGHASGTLLSELSNGRIPGTAIAPDARVAPGNADTAPAEPAKPVWSTVIIRGRETETKTFPVRAAKD